MRSTTRRIAALLVIVIATAFLSGGIPRAAAAGGKYIDQKHGFAISLLKGWQQVPTQPRDRLVTAKFMDDDKSGTSTLDIYRFKVAGGAVTTPDYGRDFYPRRRSAERSGESECPESWGSTRALERLHRPFGTQQAWDSKVSSTSRNANWRTWRPSGRTVPVC